MAAPLAVNEAEAGEETDEVDEPESAATPAAPDAKPAVKVKTRIEFDVTAGPYAPGQCTVIVALAIRPDDGHPEGRLVVLGARSQMKRLSWPQPG